MHTTTQAYHSQPILVVCAPDADDNPSIYPCSPEYEIMKKRGIADRRRKYQSSRKSCAVTRNYPRNPALQPVKGIIIFHDENELVTKAGALLKTLCCEVISSHENRFTVKTSRGNMQSIKQRWLDNNSDALSQELTACVSQIIIGGAVN